MAQPAVAVKSEEVVVALALGRPSLWGLSPGEEWDALRRPLACKNGEGAARSVNGARENSPVEGMGNKS